MKWLLIILGLLLTINGALALPITEVSRDYVESRVYNTTNTYTIDWSEDGNEYRTNRTWDLGIRKVYNSTFAVLEIDPHYRQIITVLENDEEGMFTKISLRLEENPDNPYPGRTVPFRACVNATKIYNANRFEVPNTFCPESMTQYYIGNIRFDRDYTVRFLDHPKPYVWWLGEDDYDGTFGQGGIGDGLPICEGVGADISLNQTQTRVNNSFIFKIKAFYIGPNSIGCSASWAYAQNYNDLSQWRTITSTNPPLNTNLRCLSGTYCRQQYPAWNVWYSKTVKCTSAGNRTVRTYVVGYPNNAASLNKNMECLNLPSEEEEDIPVKRPPEMPEKDYLYTLLPIAFGLIVIPGAFLMRKKKEK